jgi:single-strand DNA-binding protein
VGASNRHPYCLAEKPQDLRLSGCGIAGHCGGALQFVRQEDACTAGCSQRAATATHLNDRSFTTLSLATKTSYKKDDRYISHTEWHRCVVFGKLSEFAKTLTKGAHIQVEGELRSREYDSKKTDTKQRVWEIRVASILKLDRAEKAAPEDQEKDQEHDESSQQETAA